MTAAMPKVDEKNIIKGSKKFLMQKDDNNLK